jgi:hypothetical protein
VVDWSWAFWIGAIFAGATWPVFYFFQETYGPTILKRRAQRLRKETGDESIIAPLELEKTDLNHIVTVILTRPLRMVIFEPLVLFTCLYLSYACKSFVSNFLHAYLEKFTANDCSTTLQIPYSTSSCNHIPSYLPESTASMPEKWVWHSFLLAWEPPFLQASTSPGTGILRAPSDCSAPGRNVKKCGDSHLHASPAPFLSLALSG